MNATQRNLLMGAWKDAVAAISGVFIANTADPSAPLFTGVWFRHVGVQSAAVLILTEGRYWKQWAESGQEQPLPEALQHAADANKEVKQAIDDAKAAVPNKPGT